VAVSVQATAPGLAHFLTRQAGPHGPEEEFVIVEMVQGVTIGNVTSWSHGVEKGKNCLL
jgi:hypothetical protein